MLFQCHYSSIINVDESMTSYQVEVGRRYICYTIDITAGALGDTTAVQITVQTESVGTLTATDSHCDIHM